MYSYSYVPPRDIKKCSLVSLVGFILGFGLIYVSNFLPYATVLQIIGIAVLAVSIFMTTRYVVRRYVYSTQQAGEGDYDLVINEISGKNSKAVCRINMDEITDFIYSADGKIPEKYAGKNGKDILRFDYCQDFMPKDAYYLYATLREGKVCIKFSPDRKLADIIGVLRPKDYDFAARSED
ncbi:MAG: hypothetical protein IJZ89_03715 [Clostridia bacterium]|nr:hypothetical protein [Oscillospiraceae bacterium]MBQ8207823.1 hypothetical protein [Clostridia bacterium]